MKNNLENSIKQSLENYELEYNSSAWDAMSNKLDASAPSYGGADSSVDSDSSRSPLIMVFGITNSKLIRFLREKKSFIIDSNLILRYYHLFGSYSQLIFIIYQWHNIRFRK